MASDVDITVEILPIEQSQLHIELKIYEKLLKLFYETSELEYHNTHGELELNINKVLPYLVKEIGNLKTELEKYNSKQYTITAQTTDITAPISRPAETEQTNE